MKVTEPVLAPDFLVKPKVHYVNHWKESYSKIYPTTQSVIEFVKSEFGVQYTVSGITSLLHKLEFSYKKPKGVPCKADPEKQQEFINRYNGVKAHGLVYFGDSTHPTMNPVLSSGWLRKDRDFEVKTGSVGKRSCFL